MPRLAKEARLARHSRVIDVATLQFNWAGVAGASLEEIARRAGPVPGGSVRSLCRSPGPRIRPQYTDATGSGRSAQ